MGNINTLKKVGFTSKSLNINRHISNNHIIVRRKKEKKSIKKSIQLGLSFKAYTHILGELYEWWRTSERERDIGVSFFLSRGDHCSNVILVFTAFLLDKQKHTNITTQISIIPGRFHQHKTQIKSSAQSKVFVLAQLYVTNLHLYTSKKALVKYYSFCFLGYITYLQKLGRTHNHTKPTFFRHLVLIKIIIRQFENAQKISD